MFDYQEKSYSLSFIYICMHFLLREFVGILNLCARACASAQYVCFYENVGISNLCVRACGRAYNMHVFK